MVKDWPACTAGVNSNMADRINIRFFMIFLLKKSELTVICYWLFVNRLKGNSFATKAQRHKEKIKHFVCIGSGGAVYNRN
jgi:hypothetical protein